MSFFSTTPTHTHTHTEERAHANTSIGHGPGINLFSKFKHSSERVQHTFARSHPARNKEIIISGERESQTKTFHSLRLLLPLLPSFAIYNLFIFSLLLIFAQKNFCLEENRFSVLVLYVFCVRVYIVAYCRALHLRLLSFFRQFHVADSVYCIIRLPSWRNYPAVICCRSTTYFYSDREKIDRILHYCPLLSRAPMRPTHKIPKRTDLSFSSWPSIHWRIAFSIHEKWIDVLRDG